MEILSDRPEGESSSSTTPASGSPSATVQLYIEKQWVALENTLCIGCGWPLNPPEPAELNIPPPLAKRRIYGSFPGHIYDKKWQQYQIELVGTYIDSPHEQGYGLNLVGPILVKELDVSPLDWEKHRYAQLWLRRVHYINSPVYLESRWHPWRGTTVSIQGLEVSHRKTDIDAARRAFQILETRPGPKQKPLNNNQRALIRSAARDLSAGISLRQIAKNRGITKSRLERLLAHPEAKGIVSN